MPNRPSFVSQKRGFESLISARKKTRRCVSFFLAGMIDVFSNNSESIFTPVKLRELAQSSATREPEEPAAEFQVHRLSSRFSAEQIGEIVQRYEAGASARSLASDYDVAPSALIRLLREQKVVMRRRFVTSELEQELARSYAAGATVAELEAQHELSHNAVLRALHRAGVEMRGKGRRKSV